MATPIVSVTTTAVVSIQRLYPHVDNIKDWESSQSIRLLWDRVHDLEERLQAANATVATLLTAVNTLGVAAAAVKVTADQAYAKTQQP